MSSERSKRPQQISSAISQFLEQSGLRQRVEQASVVKEAGSTVFVHASRLDGLTTLKPGQRVMFDQMARKRSLSALRSAQLRSRYR